MSSDDMSFDRLSEREMEINKVSPTFCLAKWLQSTILLYSGQTHSCHHPRRHKVEAKSLKEDPSKLHNTPEKLKARQDLLDGKQTKECVYCWNIENLKKGHRSDRIYKSIEDWSYSRLTEVQQSGKGHNIVPAYLEIAFESTCNCKCVYCGPESSSAWQKEIEEFGSIEQKGLNLHSLLYLKSKGLLPIPADRENPYLEAFWRWWPEIYKSVKVLRITGGEPLLSKQFWNLLDQLESGPRKDLQISINSNLSLPPSLVMRLTEKINRLNNHLERIDIYTSLESTGERAEYVRHGMNYQSFMANCRRVLDNTPESVTLHFMTTINALSASTFLDFLMLIKELRGKYQLSPHKYRIGLFLNYLRWPEFQALSILPKKLRMELGQSWLQFVERHEILLGGNDIHTSEKCFYKHEVDQVRRLVDHMVNTESKAKDYENFRKFFNQIDRRRNLSFESVFPEFSFLMSKEYFGEDFG